MSIDSSSRYVVLCNGEAIISDFADCLLDYWTAETAAEFINNLSLDVEVSIRRVTLTEYNPKAVEKLSKWRVLT